MQKYELSRETHKITIVLRLKLNKILPYTARIAYEITYDMRARHINLNRSQGFLILGHAIARLWSSFLMRLNFVSLF